MEAQFTELAAFPDVIVATPGGQVAAPHWAGPRQGPSLRRQAYPLPPLLAPRVMGMRGWQGPGKSWSVQAAAPRVSGFG